MDRIRDLKHVHSFTQEATVVSRRYCQSISAVPGTDKLFPLLLLSVLVKIPLLLLPPLATGQQACPPFTRIRVMKPSSKCTNWIWSVMHMFWLANRTRIHVVYADFNSALLHITVCGVPRVKISPCLYMDNSRICPPESLLWSDYCNKSESNL